jgi:regulator of sigma E protease
MDKTEVIIDTALSEKGEPIKVELERTIDGQTEQLSYLLTPRPGASGLLDLQLNPMPTLEIASDWPVEDLNKAFTAAGVEPKVAPGMQVVRVAGQAVTDHADYARLIAAGRGRSVDVVFRDAAGREVTVQIAARPRLTYEVAAKEGDGASGAAAVVGTHHVLGLAPATVIDSISPGMPAEEAGLKVGDVIVKVGATSWPAGLKGVSAAVKAADGAPVQVVVLREGKELTFEIKPHKGLLGILPVEGDEQTVIRDVLPQSPLAEMRLPRGSRLVSVGGKEVKSLRDAQLVLTELAEANPDGFDVAVAVLKNIGNETQPVTQTVRVSAADAKALSHLSWDPTLSPRVFTVEMVTIQGENLADSMALGFRKAHKSMLQVYLTILRVVQTSVHPSQFQGPVGIAHTGTRIAKQGWTYLIFFFGLISVNLAVVNFLPIPVVDGGHMVFLLIEKIKGSPVAPKVQQAALFAGLAMLLCLFLYVTYNDILRLFA